MSHLAMQDPRLCLQGDMHCQPAEEKTAAAACEQLHNTFQYQQQKAKRQLEGHTAPEPTHQLYPPGMQQQDMTATIKELQHNGQEEEVLQPSAQDRHEQQHCRAFLLPLSSTPHQEELILPGLGHFLQGVNQQLQTGGRDLQVPSVQKSAPHPDCHGLEDPQGELQSKLHLAEQGVHFLQGVNQQLQTGGRDLQVPSMQKSAPHPDCQGLEDPQGELQSKLHLAEQGVHFLQGVNQQLQTGGRDLQLPSVQKSAPHPDCQGLEDPQGELQSKLHLAEQGVHFLQGVNRQLQTGGRDLQVPSVQKSAQHPDCQGLEDSQGELQSKLHLAEQGVHFLQGVNQQLQTGGRDLQVPSVQKSAPHPDCHGLEDPQGELQRKLHLAEQGVHFLQGVNQQLQTGGRDLQVPSVQKSAPHPDCQGLEDPQGELQRKLHGLHLAEQGVHFLQGQVHSFNQQYPSLRNHGDYKLHFTDTRYPEPLATEESPRRRARSLPWNSIPEVVLEEEEDSRMCCCKLKKKVKFADSIGLTLASVKHFLPSDEPLVPQAVLARLQNYLPTVLVQKAELSFQEEMCSADGDPPCPASAEFLARLDEQGVCLEQVSASNWGVRGCVLVKDPGEEAQVKIRYTFNEWLSFLDCSASAAQQSAAPSPAPGYQRFLFNLYYPPYTSCIHFAICCNTGHGQELWDNNKGVNYTVSCQQDLPPEIHSSPEKENWEGSQHW